MRLQLAILNVLFLQAFSENLQIEVKNLKGKYYRIGCFYEENTNNYDSNVRVTSNPGLLISSKDLNTRQGYALGFSFKQPSDGITFHGERGRCRSNEPEALRGDIDGVLQANIFISPDVPKSLGVFTIAIMSTPFDEKYELDLFIVNSLSKGKPVLKSGQPHHSKEVDLDKVIGQWITIRMTKKNNKCETVLKNAAGQQVEKLTDLHCKMGFNNTIVVNARGRDYKFQKDLVPTSFIKIESIYWEQLS